jgi:hypothetical protein
MIFQSSMGPRKSRCDVPSGTTQGCFHLQGFINDIFLRQNQVVSMHPIDLIQGVDESTIMLIP